MKKLHELSPTELGSLPSGNLQKYLRQLKVKNAGLVARNDENKRSLANSMTIRSKTNSSKVSPFLAGNIEDLNKIVWPFWFQTNDILVVSGAEVNSNINITQEAPFVITHMTKVVFEYIDLGGGNFSYQYVNPKISDSNDNIANNLFFSIMDSQSSRTWVDEPISINTVGDANDPFIFDTPYMVLGNQNLEVRFNNQSDTGKSYICSIAFHGYRMRIEEAQGILSLQSN